MTVAALKTECRSCRISGYAGVPGEPGPCPYDAKAGDYDMCTHLCCASCRRDCAEALKEEDHVAAARP